MSHSIGTVQILGAPIAISSGTTPFNPPNAPSGTRFLMLHFQNLAFNAGDQLRVELGYDDDIFTAADGPSFWTRPINVYAFPGGVQIHYTGLGSVHLDQYGRGERQPADESGHTSLSNCDPFFSGSYLEPQYDPFWYCTSPPNWENAAAVTDPSDIRAQLIKSTGIIVTIEDSDLTPGTKHISSCSVTLVDSDKVLTAGHCHQPADTLTASVCFDYQTDATGNAPAGYNPKFYKIKQPLKNIDGGSAQLDYSLLQLKQTPVGVPVVSLRPDIPAAGEQVFGLHHPNGAVKKLSIPHSQGFATVVSSGTSGIFVPTNFHVTGGSSGSGLFDAAGRIVGVASRGPSCGQLGYCPTANILADLAPTAPPAVTRDVMLVVDRSGSMSSDDGTGRSKIDTARDAVSLFVQLIKAGAGNRAGMVSFSTSASSPVDFGLAPVTNASKTTLIGGPPYSGGLVGGLTPNGATSIGDGLSKARDQFPSPGANPRAILLLTDGLENQPPMISDVDSSLNGITVHAIGLGSESNLNGDLLTNLANTHGGLYTRAGSGLSLEKFFAAAFGNIFENGVLFDPEFDLPANTSPGSPITFPIHDEDEITAIAGWDRADASLLLELITPGGNTILGSSAGVVSESGRTWTFLRVKLPFGGERNGKWQVNVYRPGGGGEFPPPTPELHYFLNVIPTGGPKMSRVPQPRRFYTGDRFNPLVIVRYSDGSWPEDIDISMTVTRPNASTGTILSGVGLGSAGSVDADGLGAREATLQALETMTGHPVVKYVDTTFALSSDNNDGGGALEAGATFGKDLNDFLNVEGNYTFHAKASFGGASAPSAREVLWSAHVEVGIDAGSTTVSTAPLGSNSGCVRMTITPKDRFGNLLGPGKGSTISLVPQPGSSISSGLTDLGHGSYTVDVCSDASGGLLAPPSVGLGQPGRPPVVVRPQAFQIFAYSVKFVCGTQSDDCCGCGPVRPGRYSTEINLLNLSDKQTVVVKGIIPLVLAGSASGREPAVAKLAKASANPLPPLSGTMLDCCSLLEALLGAPPAQPAPLSIGIIEILSLTDIAVTAVYTATGENGATPSMEVMQVQPRPINI